MQLIDTVQSSFVRDTLVDHRIVSTTLRITIEGFRFKTAILEDRCELLATYSSNANDADRAHTAFIEMARVI